MRMAPLPLPLPLSGLRRRGRLRADRDPSPRHGPARPGHPVRYSAIESDSFRSGDDDRTGHAAPTWRHSGAVPDQVARSSRAMTSTLPGIQIGRLPDTRTDTLPGTQTGPQTGTPPGTQTRTPPGTQTRTLDRTTTRQSKRPLRRPNQIDAASHIQLLEQILPQRVLTLDQIQFPAARPVLEPLLPPDRRHDVLMPFREHQMGEPVPGRETRTGADAMFPGPAANIVRNAGIQRAERLIRHDVNPAAPHRATIAASRLSKCEQRGDTRNLTGAAARTSVVANLPDLNLVAIRPAGRGDVPDRVARSSRAMTFFGVGAPIVAKSTRMRSNQAARDLPGAPPS
jgi:hypothetical protein